jgi:hypothetical protein
MNWKKAITNSVLNGVFLGVLATLAITGCRVVTDATTGVSTYAVDPAIADTVEGVAQVGVGVLPFLGGAGAVAASILGGALAVWKKMKPKLTAANTLATQTKMTAETLVAAIESLKTSSPESWTKLKGFIEEQLTKQGMDARMIKDIIEGLRLALS